MTRKTPPGQGGVSGNHQGDDGRKPTPSNITDQVRPGDAPVIVIDRELFGSGFDVTVRPPPMGIGHDREFASYGDALDYALHLQKATAWRLRDLASG